MVSDLMPEKDREVFEMLNKLRTDPKSFIRHLKTWLMEVDG